MIAARLAGGNLFFAFFGWRGFWEHSEQLGALGFFEGWGFLGIIFDWFCRIFGLGSFVL